MKCAICNIEEAEHEGMAHVFVDPDATDQRLRKPDPPPESQVMPRLPASDMILRMVLIEKGLVTDSELTNMEEFVSRAREQGLIPTLVPGRDGMERKMISPEQLMEAMR